MVSPEQNSQQNNTQATNNRDSFKELLGPSGGTGTGFESIVMADLDWSGAAPVKGIGFRFLIPIPDLGAESIEHTVKNWKGENELIKGYKFRNLTDSADQAVTGDGKGIIILAIDAEKTNGKEIAMRVLEKVADLGGVGSLNTQKLDQLLNYIRKELKVTDIYNSDDSITSSMVAQAGLQGPGDRPFGYFEKADKSGPEALFVARPSVVLDGPHAGEATYPSGFMAVKIPPKKEGGEPSYRSIAPEAVGYCYVHSDGSAIYVGDLPQR